RGGEPGTEAVPPVHRPANPRPGHRPDGVPQPGVRPDPPPLLPVQVPGRTDRVEQPVLADHPGLVARRRRVRLGEALAPYLLSLPAGLWLLALFPVALGGVVSLSPPTCNFRTRARPATLARGGVWPPTPPCSSP